MKHCVVILTHIMQDFIGREALVKQRQEGLAQLLGIFTVDMQNDSTSFPWGNESIYRDGQLCGYVTSAGFGHSLGKAVCMGYVCAAGRSGVARSREENTTDGRSAVVTRRYLKEGEYQMEIDGKLWPATLHLTPPL